MLCVFALTLFGVLSYVFQLSDFLRALRFPGLSLFVTDKDFSNYWMAGRMAFVGEQRDLFDHAIYFSRLQEVFGADSEIRNWSYPPHFLLLLWPLAFLPYKAALVAFLGSTFVLFSWSVYTFRRAFAPDSDPGVLLLAVTGYVVMMVVTAQNGFLTASLLLLGLAWMKQRPVLAGLAFAVLTIKPQLGLLIPLLLAFDRKWAAILWSAFFTIVLIALSSIFFGFESWHAYLTETLGYQHVVMTEWYGIFLRMMPTVFGGMRTLGYSPETAFAFQWPVSVLSIVVILWLLWKEPDPLRRAFAVTAGTFLVSPYGFNYDMGALVVAAAVLLGSPSAPSRSHFQLAIAMVAGLAAVVMNLGRAGLPVAPVILAGALIAIAGDVRRRRRGSESSHSAAG
jgi:hypothetical protein